MKYDNISFRSRVEKYAKEKYNEEPEQLPFNHEDYAVLRHADTGKWYAVFIVKSRCELGLDGKGEAEIMSVKIPDRMCADFLMQQSGYLRGFPSSKWNWTSVVLDGTVPFEEVCRCLDESYRATISKTANKKTPLVKRRNDNDHE